jgi:addiction module HigA family antidote
MAEYEVKRGNHRPQHPGFLIADTVIPATGMSISAVSRHLGISRQRLHSILAERAPITPQIAARMGKLFEMNGEILLKMQANLDYWDAQHTIDLSSVPTVSDLRRAPVSNVSKRMVTN